MTSSLRNTAASAAFIEDPRLRTAVSIIAGTPVLYVLSRRVCHIGGALVISIGPSILFFVSTNVRVGREDMP
jgi:hypothetical protein